MLGVRAPIYKFSGDTVQPITPSSTSVLRNGLAESSDTGSNLSCAIYKPNDPTTYLTALSFRFITCEMGTLTLHGGVVRIKGDHVCREPGPVPGVGAPH